MSKLAGAAALTGFLGSSEKDAIGDDRLLDLYWNRARLKKEFSALRKERFKLLDALTEEEGRVARYRQKLEYLEDLLSEEDTAHDALVYFSLRKLWRKCNRRLVEFSGQLIRQRQSRQTAAVLEQWEASKRARIDALLAEKDRAGEQMTTLRLEAEMLVNQIADLSGIARLFKGRRYHNELDGIEARIASIASDIAKFDEEIEKVTNEEPPESGRISLEARRAINVTVIAFAERIAEHFDQDDLIAMARLTQQKGVGATRYGDEETCRALLRRIRQLSANFELVERDASFGVALKKHAREIHSVAQYNKKGDSTPTPGSLNACRRNVLANDTWSVSQALIA